MPAGGAELRILGKAVERVIAGNADGTMLYAVTSAGMSRSDDGGRTWTAAGVVQPGTTIVSLNNTDVLYAGAHAPCAIGGDGATLTRSTDAGQTWNEFDDAVEPLLALAGTHTRVVATRCALALSDDGGQRFIDVSATTNYDTTSVASNDATLNKIVVLGTSEGGTTLLRELDIASIQRRDRSGRARHLLSAPALSLGMQICLSWQPPKVLASALTMARRWQWSRAGLESVTFSVDPLTDAIPPAEQGKSFGFSTVALNPQDGSQIWIGGPNGAWRSVDGGQTWSQLGDNSGIDSLVVSSADQRVFVSSDGGTRVWTLSGQ